MMFKEKLFLNIYEVQREALHTRIPDSTMFLSKRSKRYALEN
jgi:hypothetical protein